MLPPEAPPCEAEGAAGAPRASALLNRLNASLLRRPTPAPAPRPGALGGGGGGAPLLAAAPATSSDFFSVQPEVASPSKSTG